MVSDGHFSQTHGAVRLNLEGGDNIDLTRPRTFDLTETRSSKSAAIHQKLLDVYGNTKVYISSKLADRQKLLGVMQSAEGIHLLACHAVSTLTSADMCPAFGETNGELQPVDQVSPVMVCQLQETFAIKIDTLPPAGSDGFLVCYEGFIVVYLVDLKDVLEKDEGLETIDRYIENMSEDAWGKLTKVGLPEKHGVYVPFGWVPIIVPLGPNLADDEEHSFPDAYVFYPTLDRRLHGDCDLVRGEVRAWLVKAMARAGPAQKQKGKWQKPRTHAPVRAHTCHNRNCSTNTANPKPQ